MSGNSWDVWLEGGPPPGAEPALLQRGRWHDAGLSALWDHFLRESVAPDTGLPTGRIVFVTGLSTEPLRVAHPWSAGAGAQRLRRWAEAERGLVLPALADASFARLRRPGTLLLAPGAVGEELFAMAAQEDSLDAFVARARKKPAG